MSAFLKIGHRGARTYETENTLESFNKALELGANAIELDVRVSRDGRLIISHDDDLKRVYGKDARISESTLYELKELTENRIASLEEVFQVVDSRVEKILVELKEAGYEKKTLELVKKVDLKDRVIVISFEEEVLARVRDLDGEIETGLVYAKGKKPVEKALKLRAQYLVALYRFIHRRDVAKAHKSDLKVIAWTINTKEAARLFIAKDVDGIATDKPAIFKGIA